MRRPLLPKLPLVLILASCDGWRNEEPNQPPPEPVPIRDAALAKIALGRELPGVSYLGSTDDLDEDGFADLLFGTWSYEPEHDVMVVVSSSLRGNASTDDPLARISYGDAAISLTSVLGHGDLNGDGRDDYLMQDGDHPSEHAVVIAGGQAGLIPTSNPLAEIVIDSGICTDNFSYSLYFHVQDVTNDGVADVIAWCNTIENNPTYGSFDYLGLFRGPLSGELSAWDADLLIFETIGDAANLGGGEVRGIGDWSGDGLDELMIPAWKYQDTTRNAFLFVDASTTGQVDRRDIDDALLGDDIGGVAYVTAAGDANNDGYADLALGLYDYDSEVLYAGLARGPIEGPVYRADALVFSLRPPTTAWSIGPIERSADMDGDGWVDLLVTAHVEWEDDRLYVVHGPLEGSCTLELAPSVGGFTGREHVPLLDDIDGDALPDLAIYDEERALVYLLPGTVL